MSHVSVGRMTLTAGMMAALVAGVAPGAAASHEAAPGQGGVLKQGAHPCMFGGIELGAQYCHGPDGKARPITLKKMSPSEMGPRPNLVCLDHAGTVKFQPAVTAKRQDVLFTGTGTFDDCSSPSNKLPKARSARLVLSGVGKLALENVSADPGSDQSACHAGGELTGEAELIWYDQKGQKGNAVGTTTVAFGRKAAQGAAGLGSTGKVTQASPEVAELRGNEVSSSLKPQPGKCPAGFDELKVGIDATFYPARQAP